MRRDDERSTADILVERDIKQATAESLIRQLSEAVGAMRRLDSSAWASLLADVEAADDPARVTMYRPVVWHRELDEQRSLRSPLLEISVGEDTSRDTSMVVSEAVRMRRLRREESQRETDKAAAAELLAANPGMKHLIDEEVRRQVGPVRGRAV
jgi:hypothetical protein